MISMNWVGDFVDIKNEDLKELAVKVTNYGMNVEKVITNKIDNLVIGQIKEVKKHPDSDHLNVCMVDIGSETVQIVCGASNVKEGLKVIVAKPGCVLPGNNEIKKGKIRGVESNGMICALFELGLEEKTEETYAKGIAELGSDATIGEDPIDYLGLEDTVYELDVHKHRNNDCYYHIGFAYIVASILNKKVKMPDLSFKEEKESVKDNFKLTVDTDNCPYYLAKLVRDVKIGESPDFIKKRLISAGMRPINNVVDISNYVMLEFGQPLHFFDKDRLGNNVLVRMAKDGEEITTLDKKQRTLTSNDIVITDGEKPVCIAGVMGGENTEVENDTKNILIESAIFNPYSIRNTAGRLNLRSEASIRYGKGLSYEYTNMAIKRACHLLEKYADGKVLSDTVIHDKIDKTQKIVTFKAFEVNKLLGIQISDDDMKLELEKLDFKYTYKDGVFKCTIPSRRGDIDPKVADIAEEIGMLYGYHNLKSTLPLVETKKGEYKGDVGLRKSISKKLRALGLNEVKTYTLVSKEMSEQFNYEHKENKYLPNPMSADKAVIRTSILPSLLNIYSYNKKRHVNDINIYEIAKTYDVNYEEDSKIAILMSGNYVTNTWQNTSIKANFYLLKGIIENILDFLGFKNRYHFEVLNDDGFHPGISAKIILDKEEIGVIGKIHPSINKDDIYLAEVSMTKLNRSVKPLKFKAAPIYPEIVKDVAFIVSKEITSSDVEKVIKKAGGRLLTNIDVFDVYTGEKVKENEKQIAYKLTFNEGDRTLTDEEVMNVFNNIIKKVTETVPATLRDN
ncbi:MAG TPA: phenylalanine--tRNA ligase subunit beta [Candidatus Aphodocola excrementigallinarum]|uniref:Phenylalanine--tRNA ligase beta subunit n=1 Tax=Candidatus Aphodocola excrementigallinarum TaxID=2840670 RepID=A0A9D1LIB3_9FIRM|nr:phenylalanine--tRNA ligase subunit beta [Candidatus Aphodocola excrementigallinarum]